MTWRKWLVRGLVFSVLGLVALAVVAYQAWTNPTAVRAQVIAQIRSRFAAGCVSVGLESARLRLLGGIAVSELRVARTDGLDRKDFLYVPSAVIYHDKERLSEGAIAVRKLELHRPQLRVVVDRDGHCNLAGVFAPTDPNVPYPSIVVDQGTLILEDGANGATLLEIKDVSLTSVEDPPGVVTVAGAGKSDVAGPVRFDAVLHRAGGDTTATVDFDQIPVGPDLVQRLAAVCADAAAQARELSGAGSVHVALAVHPAEPQPFTYDAALRLHHGALSHACLPRPLKDLEALVHVVNGLIPLVHCTARADDARIDLTLRDVIPPKKASDNIYDMVRELDLTVDRLPVAADLFQTGPECVRQIQDVYRPSGSLNLTHTFRRDGPSQWRQRWILRPNGMSGQFAGFPYRAAKIAGTIDFQLNSDQTIACGVDLTGDAGGRPITVKGKVNGPCPSPAVDLAIGGDDLLLDDKMFNALPDSVKKTVRPFLPERSRQIGLAAAPMGRADVKATIHREAGKDFENRYLIRFHDASVQYDLFPLALEKVNGELDLRTPGGWVCRNFHAMHDDGAIRFEGRSYTAPAPVPATAPTPGDKSTGDAADAQDRIYLVIDGENLPTDADDFKNALAPPALSERAPLRSAWEALSISGRMGFHAVVDQALDQPKDIDVSVTAHGCSLRPRFFPYDLQDFSGAVRYVHEQVYLTDLRAQHGACQVALKRGHVVVKPGGGFQARLEGIRGAPLTADDEFLAALPDPLRAGLAGLHIRGPLTATTDLVVDAPGDPGGPMVLWWDGSVELRDAAVRLGVDVTGVDGQAACCGRYNGRRLESVVGNVLLERAQVFGQPLENVHTRLEVEPASPNTLRFRDLHADLYDGALGGEGRFDFGAETRFDVTLKGLRIDLAKFARHNNFGPDAQMKGLASAALHLSGEGVDISGLKGNGRIDVPEGKLYKLPLQLDLLKAFGLRVPDRTAFEQAHAVFAIDGPQLQVQGLDLLGNAVSLRGRGTVDLVSGGLNLDFNADWGRLAEVLPAGVNEIPRAMSDQLLKIKMRGSIGDVHFDKELAPGVVDWVEGAAGP
ncbi:MAG TPA: AsmA-like C-terminal region-containing protein [Gemmataceae bacterium]|nr:AsmA-like C-terminal region-containing protein [Gemmataceae bacterium]